MPTDPKSRDCCLVLEDNWLIASGLTMQLQELGFEDVKVCGSCLEATSFLVENAARLPDLAILDVIIGKDETSEPIAFELERLKIPFIIISGYGAHNEVSRRFPKAVSLKKPVSDKHLLDALDQMLGE